MSDKQAGQAQQPQMLWTDERIRERLTAWDNRGTPSEAHTAFAVLMDMRQDYEQSLFAAQELVAELTEYNHECQARIGELEDELAENKASFDLRWDASMAAIEKWQEATGETLQWPNHTDLCVWLMQQLVAATSDAKPAMPIPWGALREVMEFVDGYVGECLTTNEVELAAYDVNAWLDGAPAQDRQGAAWEPINGTYSGDSTIVDVSDNVVTLVVGSKVTKITLPTSLRVCRRVQPAQAQTSAKQQYLAGANQLIVPRVEWNERYVDGWNDGNNDAKQGGEQVCDVCEGDGETEDYSHLSPPVYGDWPMITCWKCNGTGIKPQPAQAQAEGNENE